MQDLSFLTREQTMSPAMEAQSINYWSAREIPAPFFFFFFLAKELQVLGLLIICNFCPSWLQIVYSWTSSPLD